MIGSLDRGMGREVPHPLLNTLASPKSFTLVNVQMHLTLLSLNQDFPLLRSGGLKAWPAGPVRANKRTPLKGLLVVINAIELRIFLPHPSSPARRGSTSLLNPPILRREDLKPGRLGLYSQTSSRPQGVARGYRRNRVAIV